MPIGARYLDVHDQETLEHEALLARTLGFRGKACIHPAQVETVNRVFSRTSDEIAWAHRVLAIADQAADEGRGAVLLDGALIDAPVVERARRIIRDARDDTGAH